MKIGINIPDKLLNRCQELKLKKKQIEKLAVEGLEFHVGMMEIYVKAWGKKK